jgi:hypothetical protein
MKVLIALWFILQAIAAIREMNPYKNVVMIGKGGSHLLTWNAVNITRIELSIYIIAT